MAITYLFDIDGTLTPAQEKMNPEFEKFFYEWSKNKEVYVITGNDYPKVLNTIGKDLAESLSGIFCCGGNHCFKNGKETYRNQWEPSESLISFLMEKNNASKYLKKFGNHIEKRIGTINFSTLGRNAPIQERLQYYEWDKKNKERESIVNEINSNFKEIEAGIGGQIGIDIIPKGKNKSQIASQIPAPIYFFGDRMSEGGNDEKLAKELLKNSQNKVFPVSCWQETWNILKNLN